MRQMCQVFPTAMEEGRHQPATGEVVRPLETVIAESKRHSRVVKGYVIGTKYVEWECECDDCKALEAELWEHESKLCHVINHAYDAGLDSMRIVERKSLRRVHQLLNARFAKTPVIEPTVAEPECDDMPLFAGRMR